MISYNVDDYKKMLGEITEVVAYAASCMSQCTGCKCSCKCSCSCREITEFDWEEI